MSQPLKVAFASEDLKSVDAHFGWARHIAIYHITPEDSNLMEVVQFEGELQEDGSENKLTLKLEAIRDCAIVYVAAIGGSAAARVVNLKVHPIKVPEPTRIADLISRLQEMLRGTPPPWLRKSLNQGPGLDCDALSKEDTPHVS
jgi:nitrogen fixation protein NifX